LTRVVGISQETIKAGVDVWPRCNLFRFLLGVPVNYIMQIICHNNSSTPQSKASTVVSKGHSPSGILAHQARASEISSEKTVTSKILVP
jgi:hypothetical protein